MGKSSRLVNLLMKCTPAEYVYHLQKLARPERVSLSRVSKVSDVKASEIQNIKRHN